MHNSTTATTVHTLAEPFAIVSGNCSSWLKVDVGFSSGLKLKFFFKIQNYT